MQVLQLKRLTVARCWSVQGREAHARPFLPTRHPKRDARGLQIGSRISGARACGARGRHKTGWAEGGVAGVSVREEQWRGEAGRRRGLRIQDRVPGAGAGAGGGWICKPLWNGGIWGRRTIDANTILLMLNI
jgi:hypothetical protein